jgi:lipase chaperone LimK
MVNHRVQQERQDLENQRTASKLWFDSTKPDFIGTVEKRVLKMSDSHLAKVSSIVQDFENLKDQLLKTGAAFQKRMKDSCSQCQSLFDETDKRNRNWFEMRKFYEEKVGVLARKKDEAARLFQERPPRQSELDSIERLEALLQTKTMQLQNAVQALQEYRRMRVDFEKTVSHRFGKPPQVGVFKSPH